MDTPRNKKSKPNVFFLGEVVLKNPSGKFQVYLVGGVWYRDRIGTTSIYISKKATDNPSKDGTNVVTKITIERDTHLGAFTNNSGIPQEIRILIRKMTNSLFEK